jgi:ATP-binding cassette subfamily C protein/ATP-binding cassette subfamily C protein LapB
MSLSLTAESWGSGQAPDHFVRALAHGDNTALDQRSPYARCLIVLLHALGWRGTTRHLIEILPHCAQDISLGDLRNVLAAADYRSSPLRTRMVDLDSRLLPCLFVRSNNIPLLILDRRGDRFTIYDTQRNETLSDLPPCDECGQAFIFEPLGEREQKRTRRTDSWFRDLVFRFRKQLILLAIIGLIATLPGLATPLFIMVLYDTVISAQSPPLLVQLSLAMAAFLLVDLLFRLIRAKVIAYIATRIGRLVALSTFGRLMALAPAALSRAPLHAQLRRVRQFEAWRDHFADPLVSVAFNLPFSFIFLIAIALLGGGVVLLPLMVMLLYAAFAWFAGPVLERHSGNASEARQVRDSCFDEIVTEMRAIRLLASEDIWLERFRNYAAGSALADVHRAKLQELLQTTGQSAVTLAGTGTLFLGALGVMEGDLTIGALIACMALVWRVLSPWQQCIGLLPRLAQLKMEAAMLDQVMQLPTETDNRPRRLVPPQMKGAIRMDGVTLAYEGASKPALLSVDLSVECGELVAFCGGSGTGKSSLLKVLAGIHTPQGGSVRLDGFDLRQLHPRELREQLGYAPQQPHFFTGTIAQNLRLAHPAASDQDLWNASIEAGVLDDILNLENGFETRIGDANLRQQSPGFLQRLSLARAYLERDGVLLLDEPGRALDFDGDTALQEKLIKTKGQQTVLLVTHRPSHLKLADKVFRLQSGKLSAWQPGNPHQAPPPRPHP